MTGDVDIKTNRLLILDDWVSQGFWTKPWNSGCGTWRKGNVWYDSLVPGGHDQAVRRKATTRRQKIECDERKLGRCWRDKLTSSRRICRLHRQWSLALFEATHASLAFIWRKSKFGISQRIKSTFVRMLFFVRWFVVSSLYSWSFDNIILYFWKGLEKASQQPSSSTR